MPGLRGLVPGAYLRAMRPRLFTVLKSCWLRRTFAAVLSGALLLLGLDALFPLPPLPRHSTVVTAADGTVLHAFLTPDDKWRLYTTQRELTPALRKALIFKEDRWFRWHPGVNPLAVARAAWRNLVTGRRTSGASTLTMQVARLLQPAGRTYGSKLREMARALQLEWHFSKDEILQLYVNLAPYGSNVEGLKSAALLYFQKSPEVLSLAEITALVVVPNRPSSLRLGTNNAAVRAARDRWLRRFDEAELFEKNQIADALAEPLTVRRHEAPKAAPHLSLRLARDAVGAGPIIRSTIRPEMQAKTEGLVKNYAARLRALHIRNAAVLVLDNQTRAVATYVGSADFNDPTDGGQVDGIRAVRSPGSALKPLLYATAIDRGILTPKTQLLDVPTSFGGYEPVNFDQNFHGPVTAEFALANSLNVPAVRLLRDVTTPVLVGQLKKAGFETVKRAGPKLGLSLVLGGCGVTLEELTNLFAAFAHEGKFEKARLLQSAGRSSAVPLVSPEAAFLTTTILAQIIRPDLPNGYEYTYRLPKIAWKTGTSFGKRDAWSIGYNARFTVGVWVGNFSGEGVPELSGAALATPLLFDVFNAIDYNAPVRWFGAPRGLMKRKVCPVSGLPPGGLCERSVLDDHLPGVTATPLCQHQRAVFTNATGTFSYCTRCQPDSGAVRRPYPNLAPELIAWYEGERIPYAKIPPHNPACTRVFAEGGPVIVSPLDGGEFFLSKTGNQQLALRGQVPNGVGAVFWYVNDRLLRKAGPGETVFFRPQPGKVRIACVDDQGRKAAVGVVVRWE